MKLTVADSAGTGTLVDKDGVSHQLSADSWTETDLRDRIVAGDGGAHVRYREDGRTVDVPAGATYDIEAPANDDVIDVRTATDAAHLIAEATATTDTDTPKIFAALEMVPHDHSRQPWIEQLEYIFRDRTGFELHELLQERLTTDEYARALTHLE